MGVEDLVNDGKRFLGHISSIFSQPGGFSRLARDSVSFFLSLDVPIDDVVEEACKLSRDGNFNRYFFELISRYDPNFKKNLHDREFEKKLAYHLTLMSLIGTTYLVEKERYGDFFRFLESYKGKTWFKKK